MRGSDQEVEALNQIVVGRTAADERRRFQRSVVRLPVVARIGARRAPSISRTAIDVSAGGMLISPGLEAKVDDKVYVTARDFGQQIEARVVDQRSQGTALRFLDTAQGELIMLWLVEQSIRRAGA